MKQAPSSILLAALFLVSIPAGAELQKRLVGATEVVYVREANLSLQARVDTGAKTSSIHAENIRIETSGDPRGKAISFDLVTNEGHSITIETRVISVVKVRNTDQSESRFVVPLNIKWRDSEKMVAVTLNDRSRMQYRMLLGRNWLRGDFIVDVEKNDAD